VETGRTVKPISLRANSSSAETAAAITGLTITSPLARPGAAVNRTPKVVARVTASVRAPAGTTTVAASVRRSSTPRASSSLTARTSLPSRSDRMRSRPRGASTEPVGAARVTLVTGTRGRERRLLSTVAPQSSP
jgi:hypothetical protein